MASMYGVILSLCLGLIAAAPPSADAAMDATSLAYRVAEAHARQVQGIVCYQSIRDSVIQAPLFHQKLHSVTYTILKDGLPVRTMHVRLVTNGREASRRELLAQEQKDNQALREGKYLFKAPYDSRFVGDYSFTADDSAVGQAGSTAIRFTARRKDPAHGNGVMVIDAQRRVTLVRYTPAAMPEHASSGTVVLQEGEVTPGLVEVRSVRADFTGSLGPIKGTFAMDVRFEGYHRYKSIDEAVQAHSLELATRP